MDRADCACARPARRARGRDRRTHQPPPDRPPRPITFTFPPPTVDPFGSASAGQKRVRPPSTPLSACPGGPDLLKRSRTDTPDLNIQPLVNVNVAATMNQQPSTAQEQQLALCTVDSVNSAASEEEDYIRYIRNSKNLDELNQTEMTAL
ncbi:unnamed protein product, partial [Nesidiocoris tenuis]